MTAPVDLPQLTALLERANLPWAYRPQEHDDWGTIRSTVATPEGWHPVTCQARYVGNPTDDDLGQHRRDKTDPTEGNAALIVAAVNALPALIAELTAARERLAGEGERMMREALLWADEHADDQDVNHVNFRVGAGSRARTALAILERISND